MITSPIYIWRYQYPTVWFTNEITNRDYPTLVENYRKGISKGLYKIISKMGISTIQSYRGAQLFEIVGLGREVVDLCFRGTTCRIQIPQQRVAIGLIGREPGQICGNRGFAYPAFCAVDRNHCHCCRFPLKQKGRPNRTAYSNPVTDQDQPS